MPLDPPDIYCAEQIFVPPTFPGILKQYTKAAIRTQPYDLLRWSAAYFRALAKGERPPVKERLEYPQITTESGLSPGFLKVLIQQIGKECSAKVCKLQEIWDGLCLDRQKLKEMLQLSGCQDGNEVDWLSFIAVASGHLNENLQQTMQMLCELLTEEPEGGCASIPMYVFQQLYQFLAEMDCPEIPGIGPRVPEETTKAALNYLQEMAASHSGFIMPRHTTHILCPPLY
ncbi:ropporin-1-like protein [Ischnura elegans]|uniref:ropporin-1-like protein n=1 Tax=Ischnura elegans TaxID=197161 RepID=UPI001ED8A10A|nr:ropporin-1-like protein [Ischnura elegans]XP_046382951.1 ropporin-1-like protein [Ischnura elegans]